MTEQHQSIPLNKLVPWGGNVRKTEGADTALAELAASIAAHGLLQSLVVRKDRPGKYAVVAGRRRLLALTLLAEEGRIDSGMEIPCRLIGEDEAAEEISLAENAIREQMHPADEFEAFRGLIDAGASVTEVAARFGYAESTVEKRLKLARVSPFIIAAYRAGETGLEQVMAFAVSEDHAAQERIWSEGPDWIRLDAGAIRDALTEGDIAASDRRVKFITLKAYEKAGGATRRDLFSEGDEGVFILDAALLDQLAQAKLEKTAKTLRKEGWKWVETHLSFGYDEAGEFQRLYPETLPLTGEEAAELAALEAEADASYDIEGELTPEEQARFEWVTNRLEDLTDNREEIWPAETLSIAGAVVSIGRDGKADVTRGLVRPEDLPEKPKAKANGDARGGLPAALIESLTAERSSALTAALIEKPGVALAAVAHLFAARVFCGRSDTSLDVIVSPRRFKGEGSKAHIAIESARETWRERLPGDAAQLWRWCLEQHPHTLLDLLAFCAALTIDAVKVKGKADAERIAHADALAEALAFDIAAWFQPTAGNYFGRVAKPQILTDLQQAKGVPPAPAWSSLKKAELAALAERETAGTGWMPEPLRAPAPADEPLRHAA